MGSRIAALLASAAMLLAGGVVSSAYADEPTQAPVADAPACQAGDWAALKSCITGNNGSVTITAPITAADETITVSGAKTVSVAKDGDGVFGGDGTSRKGPVFEVPDGASLTINGGTYSGLHAVSGNDSGANGALIHASGTVTINGGRFQNNSARNGGVIFQEAGTLTVTGGTFENNTANANGNNKGGGAIYAKGTTVISGSAKFEANRQSAASCDTSHPESCMQSRSGGGAVYQAQGTLIIHGGVKFDHNGVTASGWNSGGGAVWAQGTLTIKNDSEASRPNFTDNYASVTDTSGTAGPDGTGDPHAANGIQRGGAGGAVFLNATSGSHSTGYITGGVYTGNVSGYLGGAIYTEEYSLTYVGRAVATQNNAGHFGGGLWFCPSGESTASKGGNIALYDNHVDAEYDANQDNQVNKETPLPDGADTTVAGSDLAIMNPYWKVHNNWLTRTEGQFQLLNTWFTDRAADAVTWYWDNTPLRESSGYHDSWLPTAGGVNQKNGAVLASTKIHDATVVMEPGLLTITSRDNAPEGYITTGLALKAAVIDTPGKSKESKEQEAWNSARLRFSGNSARLSGGAFASNGVVVFDTPYSMDWDKIDSVSKHTVAAASTWRLTYTPSNDPTVDSRPDAEKSPYFDQDMRPADCPVTSTSEYCWHVDKTGKWTVLVRDNGRDGAGVTHDNNPAIGSLSLDNLAPGDYTLQETEAPNGYQLTDKTYKFQIRPAQNNGLPQLPKLLDEGGNPVGDNVVENVPISGVLAWSKTDSETNTAIGGSEWKIVNATDGDEVVDGYDAITDCEREKCTGKDVNPDSGAFKLVLGENGLKAGTYKLVETKAPDGHWLPANASHAFTVTGDLKVEWTGEGDKNATTLNIPNTPTEVSWLKVGAENGESLSGSVWTVTRVKDGEGKDIANSTALTVVDCASDECKPADNALPDEDKTAGVIHLTRLDYGTYDLVESQAPAGYVKSGKTYTFTITKEEPTAAVEIKDGDSVVTDNKIVNAKALAALPLTGGRSALDWAVAGGVLAVLAVGVAVVQDRLRRRALGL